MAEKKIRSRVPWLRLFLILLVPVFTFKEAAINMFAPRPPTKEQRHAADMNEQVQLRRARLGQLFMEGDRCRPLVAREIAKQLAFDGQPVDAYADDYARRCGADDDVIRKWASLRRRQELRELSAPVRPARAEAALQ